MTVLVVAINASVPNVPFDATGVEIVLDITCTGCDDKKKFGAWFHTSNDASQLTSTISVESDTGTIPARVLLLRFPDAQAAMAWRTSNLGLFTDIQPTTL